MPQATEDAAGQLPQQTRSVPAPVPGGLRQVWPLGQSLPTPEQLRQALPLVSPTGLGMGVPHAMSRAFAQFGQHSLPTQPVPERQSVPVPLQAWVPMQVAGIASPHVTALAARHWSVHAHAPSTHIRPPVHGPSQRPPQPSASPQFASVQAGMQSHCPVSGLHTSWLPGHVPLQKPPQPSGVPQAASGAQLGTHWQRFAMQRSGGVQAGSQAQVSTQLPFWQTSPGLQLTPKQGFWMHSPARQNSPSSQVTPSHAERGVQVR